MTSSNDWFVGQNLIGRTPHYVMGIAFPDWNLAFEALRDLYHCDLWEAGDECPAAHLENLAFAQGYCEGMDFHFYSGMTKVNYFIMQAEDFFSHWRLQ